jgi:hypothetical protein
MAQKQPRHLQTRFGFLLAALFLGPVPVMAVSGCSAQSQPVLKRLPPGVKGPQNRFQAAPTVGTRPVRGVPAGR